MKTQTKKPLDPDRIARQLERRQTIIMVAAWLAYGITMFFLGCLYTNLTYH